MKDAGLGLDLSTRSTGFAFAGAGDYAPRTGVWKLPGAGEDVIDRTLGMLADSIAGLFKLVRFTDVAIEAPLWMDEGSNAHTMSALIQASGVARATVYRNGARVHMVGSSTVRKHFVGNGRLKKSEAKEIIVARCEEIGWSVQNHDAADAAATWSWLMAKRYPGSPAGSFAFGTPLLRRKAA